MKYFAHRGASALAPGNSLPAFALAREMGSTCYELDVHMCRDGALVVHHDYYLGRDTTCLLDIKNVTYNELKHCLILHGFDKDLAVHPPLLREVLPIVAEDLEMLNVEIKNDDNAYPNIEKAVWECFSMLGPEGMKKILFSSFDYPTLQRLRKIAPSAQIGLLTRMFEPQKAHNIGAYSVHMNKTRITKEIVDICHRDGRKVFVYTVNDKYTARSLERIGVDGIFTDNPSLFLQNAKQLPPQLCEKYTPVKLSKKTKFPRF